MAFWCLPFIANFQTTKSVQGRHNLTSMVPDKKKC
jgi:hypothetical protein